jgi:hypothetical protein
MATGTTTAPSPDGARAEKNRLILAIGRDCYDAARQPDGDWGTQCWRLSKHGPRGEVYDVWMTRGGHVACDCPDFQYRHRGTTSRCKHGCSAVEMGLIVPPDGQG